MAVNPLPLNTLHPVAGIHLATTNAGIKQTVRDDLLVIQMQHLAAREGTAAAVFTRNAFCAAPVVVARENVAQYRVDYLLINSGNANAGTGEQGLVAARATCQAIAEQQGCDPRSVLPFSTGVIGQPLPVSKIVAALPKALSNLQPANWEAAAKAIMTTDTLPKGVSHQFSLQNQLVTITGIAKGAGMIRPDMATMLSFIATDVALPKNLLQQSLQQAVEASFNRITIDGDTSTNDACVLFATGHSGVVLEHADDSDYAIFLDQLTQVCRKLAQAIVRDGEGATKFITVDVSGGANEAECLAVAYSVAHSPLVKTAFFASDANWGRILAAIGRAGLSDLAIERVQIDLNDVAIVRQGGVAASYTEAQGQAVMQHSEITIHIDLGRGTHREQVWTCDFSHDYVSINADYRT
ncbi:bifunctional glutamate N-acetyltransferase/amino-acid acetyltransferase ArgJ [Thioflexithrix psekupsensis]|uniref:Arginine biosynthesis bifunctional protein ArgJ n=1 Tax=Thioflexithrix psekupsensis TaxID=1570016 RepID=A0A251XAA9_9GAMM|nr:bifunctional glutamate N-acetyltransferase/amino-acid acetyltransferase ArgJ [Thioflexithrix psekupsensis]OUD15274.1 bifunctional ornithine acetyltransferase/N-acetylglutamate synthase [Thioflexithrix psekupsensis]